MFVFLVGFGTSFAAGASVGIDPGPSSDDDHSHALSATDGHHSPSIGAEERTTHEAVASPLESPIGPPEDDLAVVRFEDEHVVSGSIVENLPPDPAVSAGGDELVIDEHDDYDHRVLQTTNGDVATVDSGDSSIDNRPIERVENDPDLVIVGENNTVRDELEIDRGDGIVRTAGSGDPIVVGDDPVTYSKHNTVDLDVNITDVTDVEEGETLAVDAEVSNSMWAHASGETITFRLLDSSGNVRATSEDTISVDGNDRTPLTFFHETKTGDYLADEVEVELSLDDHDGSGDVDTADVDIGAAGVAVAITDTNRPVEGGDLIVDVEIDRYGAEPPGEQRYPISFFVDGEEQETQVRSLSPGSSTTETFRYETDGDDLPEVEAMVTSRTDTHTVDVPLLTREEHENNIEATITETNVDQLNLTGELEVDATFDYDGETPTGQTTFPANFTIDGTVEEQRNVTVTDPSPTNETFVFDRNETDPPIQDVVIATPGENATVVFDRRTDLEFVDVTDPAARNDTLETTVSVEDVGETPGQDTLTIETVNPVAADNATRNRTISLEGGESTTETVAFDLTDDAPPRLELRASTGDAAETRTVEVRDNVPVFAVEDVRIEGADDPDSEIGVIGTLVNEGGATGTQTVELTFDGDPIRTQELTLEPDESETLSAGVPTADPGTYAYGATTADDTYSDTTTADEMASDSSLSLPSLPVGLTGIVAVLASVLGLVAIGAGALKYRENPAAVRAQVRQLRNTVLEAVPVGESGTVVVRNDLPRASLVRVRVKSGNDVVFIEDFEIAENERRTFECLPDADRFEVGAGVDDITSHEETFGEETDTVGVLLQPEGITIREL
ncbi:COG1361 family protein [Halobiforma nitratireducens]|uniref:CARDB domain-containing protein n=1 Tax=Halobiforma nitratireducens JCM 10879 TaxID=1227454 RepID=M0LFR9_9EURY|nr:hypothetical protein [Halobiforma nitratireducens]EMA32391.1 hypothetical protein C446_14804 [Halobiforma nitratireducens JCM 10879]